MSSNLTYSNGHSAVRPNGLINGGIGSSSESDLSEVLDGPHLTIQPAMQDNQVGSYFSRKSSISSNEEDAIGSDDADYDMETPPPADMETSHTARSSSQDSRRPAKRKAAIEEDTYILKNPELYGIRRSVSTPLHDFSSKADLEIGSCSSNNSYRT